MSILTKAIWIATVLLVARGIATATWETHDWTISVNGTTYGLQEMYDLPDQRTTLLFYGGDTYRIIHAPIYLVTLAAFVTVVVPPALAIWLYGRYRRHRTRPNHFHISPAEG